MSHRSTLPSLPGDQSQNTGGHNISGNIIGCGTAIQGGQGHKFTGVIAGCNTGISGGTGHDVAGVIAGCSIGVAGGEGHDISGTIVGCRVAVGQSDQGGASRKKIKILFLAAMPHDQLRLRLDEEHREIGARIRSSECRDQLELVSEWAVRVQDLQEVLLRERPHIVHFSGHGSAGKELLFEDDIGHTRAVGNAALKNLFRILNGNTRVVVLNACYSQTQAEAITEVLDCAVGMKHEIGDAAAVAFAAAFYQALGYAQSVQVAFDLGCNALELLGIPEENTPSLLIRKGIDAGQVILTGTDGPHT